MTQPRLGVGFIGSGFNARFHIQSWTGVRDADVLGVFSPNSAHAEGAAALARTLNVGEAKTYSSIADMVEDPGIGAIWLCGPNQARIQNIEEIVETVNKGRGELRGVACEKPLARTVGEARRVAELIKGAEQITLRSASNSITSAHKSAAIEGSLCLISTIRG